MTDSQITSRLPVKSVSEKIPLIFDFSADLSTGETLNGTPTVTFLIEEGADASPNGIANGPAAPDATLTKIVVPVQAGLDGCDYRITVLCATTNTLKTPIRVGILPVRGP